MLLTFFLFFSSNALHAQQSNKLFELSGNIETEWPAKSVSDIKKAPVEFNLSVLTDIRNGLITSFEIESLDSEKYTVEVKRVISHLNDDWSITGHINGDWRNSFTLSYSEGMILSSINNIDDHSFFEIRFSKETNSHRIIEINPHERDEISCGIHDDHTTEGSQSFKQQDIDQVDEGTAVIDVMIVYTVNARNWAMQNSSGIQNIINQSMAVAQETIDNSEIDLEFRLVHSALVDYTESDDSYVDLRRLTTSPTFTPWGSQYSGYMDEVHVLRDLHKADLVALFTLTNDVGGLAWRLNSIDGSPRFGFSISRVQQAAGTTHVHEMGHNMGNAHSRNQSSSAAGPSGGLFEYSTGWRWTGTNNIGYTSVMTYNQDDQPVNIFSNPDITFQGVPTGSYTGNFSPSDNSRSIREIKHVVAAYRQSSEPPLVESVEVLNISAGKAEGVGIILDSGETDITETGFCWNSAPDPELSNSCGTGSIGEDLFQTTFTNLNGNTKYYARAYAINDGGISYGGNIEFNTKDISVPNSTVEASIDRVLATGEQSSKITVTVLNSEFEPVENAYIEIKQTGGFSDIRVINDITDYMGNAQFSVTNRIEGDVRYTIIADDLELNDKPEIRFVNSDGITSLGNNYPNPFNNQTVIPIVIPEQTRVKIEIFNALGSRIETIFDQQTNVGYYEIPFNASRLSSGIYFYRMTTDTEIKIEKMLLLK